jgi:hypothetical protein
MKSKCASARTSAPATNEFPIVPVESSQDAGRLISRRPTVRMGIELAVGVGNSPGQLAKVLGVVAACQVELLAYCTLFDGDRFAILLVTDASWVAKTALAAAGFACTAHAVVLVRAAAADLTGTPPALVHRLCEAGIAIWYAYDAVLHPLERCTVFSTTDDQRAIQVLAATDLTFQPVAR